MRSWLSPYDSFLLLSDGFFDEEPRVAESSVYSHGYDIFVWSSGNRQDSVSYLEFYEWQIPSSHARTILIFHPARLAASATRPLVAHPLQSLTQPT